MATGVNQMLQDVEDLSLKAYVASRCASRQLQVDSDRASRLVETEKRVVSWKKEKANLQEALATACSKAKKMPRPWWLPVPRLRKMPRPRKKLKKRGSKPKRLRSLLRTGAPVAGKLFSDGAMLSALALTRWKLTCTGCSRNVALCLQSFHKSKTSRWLSCFTGSVLVWRWPNMVRAERYCRSVDT